MTGRGDVSDAPEGDLAGLIARDEGLGGAGGERADAVVVAVQRVGRRRIQRSKPPAPHQLRAKNTGHPVRQLHQTECTSALMMKFTNTSLKH